MHPFFQHSEILLHFPKVPAAESAPSKINRHHLYWKGRATGYGDKRLCNKRPGPGGGTRRLHHKPTWKSGFLWGRNRIDGRVKTALLPGMVPPLSDYCLGANDNEMALAA